MAGNAQYTPSLLDPALSPGRGTAQKPLQPIATFAVDGGEFTSADGAPTISSVLHNTGLPAETAQASRDTGAPVAVCKVDAGNLFAIRPYLANNVAESSDLGASFTVVLVTEKKIGTKTVYQRQLVAVVDVSAGTSATEVTAALTNPVVLPNDHAVDASYANYWYFCDHADVVTDLTFGTSAKVVGDQAGAHVEILIDFIGNGWIEIYPQCAKGTLGANNANAFWAEWRIL